MRMEIRTEKERHSAPGAVARSRRSATRPTRVRVRGEVVEAAVVVVGRYRVEVFVEVFVETGSGQIGKEGVFRSDPWLAAAA